MAARSESTRCLQALEALEAFRQSARPAGTTRTQIAMLKRDLDTLSAQVSAHQYPEDTEIRDVDPRGFLPAMGYVGGGS